MTQIAQIQKTIKANKTKAFGTYLDAPDSLTTSFKTFKWSGISESIIIENDSDVNFIEYSLDGKQIFRIEAGDVIGRDDIDASKILLRGEAGGESFKLEVSYR